MTVTADRLTLVRHLYSVRGGAWGGSDVAYLVYIIILLGSLLAFPLVRAIVVFLTAPAVLAALGSSAAGSIFAAVVVVLLGVMIWLGKVRGPVTPQPFFVMLLASTDLVRSVALRRTFLTSASVAGAAFIGVGVLFTGVLVAGGAASAGRGVVFLLAVVCLAFIASVLWLAGQTLRMKHVGIIATVLIVTAALTLHPATPSTAPWGWLASLWPTGPGPSMYSAVVLLLAVGVGGACVPRLLNSLSGHRLLQEAQQWQAATTAALSGDVAYALGSLRALPAVGRRWAVVASRVVPLRYLRADLLAALRTPGRFVIATLFLVGAWLTVGLSVNLDPSIVWLPAAAGTSVGFLALGVFSDGFRHAADTARTSPLYGYAPSRLYRLHALLPLAGAGVAAIAGVVMAVALGASPAAAALGGAAILLVLVTVRAYDSAKGELPVILLTPAPTPGGDASAVLVFAWQTDALLIAGAVGAAVMTMIVNGASLNAVVLAALVIGGLVLRLRRRLRLLR